nr:reverse transcriptase domain-containing protein [Tanacetum cinerariifolium]
MKSQQSTNAFVKETFMDLKTQLETVEKNHQALIQNLETKFNRLADKKSGRPFGSFPRNTQPNVKGYNFKAYQPLQSRNEHVNVVFKRIGKSYNPPVNLNDQQNDFENPINFDSDEEDEEPTPQLKKPSFLPVIISSQLSKEKKEKLVSVRKKHKQAFAWKTTDIPGICLSFYKHKIQLLDDKKPVVQKQRSPWVSPILCVPKKCGITVVTNENDELGLTRTVTGWRVCIDYHKLNEATAKDHPPLPFMDQMLERLARNKYFYFLDGFSGYFHIPIDLNDQEKITFTCPFRTYAYRRMPFGLCNAHATFQRCMLAIFRDMIKETVEVFMDDFSVFGNSFETYLNNLDKMLQRCKDAYLVLNWEKCHFMVKEGILLGHKVSSAGLEVDKAKIEKISKLPPLIILKVRNKQEKDKIGTKPDKNGKRGEAEKILKQLQWIKREKPKKTQKEWSKTQTRSRSY